MTSPVEVVNNVIEIAKALRDIGDLVKNAQTKKLTADLNLALADLKQQVAALQDENLELKRKISVLESADDIRAQLELKDTAYWFSVAPPPGHPQGPYCTGCFDLSERLVVLNLLTGYFTHFGKYVCPVCKQHFGEA